MNKSFQINRREFCRTLAIGVPGMMFGLGNVLPAPRTRAGEEKQFGIIQLNLRAHRLEELRSFYHQLFHFPIKAETKSSIIFQAGSTLLTFEQTEQDDQPFYHFAFNIPENKLSLAKEWLTQRVPLARPSDGREVLHFPNWNAHAIYYWDPAGNLGELIARHDLPNAHNGPFTAEDILYASEIGIVVDDVPALVNWAKENLQLSAYRPGSETFAPIGDEHQLLIVAKKPRPWFQKPSEIFPTAATLRGISSRRLELADYPYTIAME